MSGDEQSVGKPPRSSARLQPEDRFADPLAGVAELIEEVEADRDLLQNERADVEETNERLARLRADNQLYERLRKQGFSGTEYRLFESELAAYAFPVLRKWIRQKWIYPWCAAVGCPISATDHIRQHLAEHEDDRIELANETVAITLEEFHERALAGDSGRWSPERGASLKTYFMGACLRSFPKVFRKWLKEQGRDLTYGLDTSDIQAKIAQAFPNDANPATVVANEQAVLDQIAAITDPATREAAFRVVFLAETHEEAGSAVGLTSRGVEGRFYRHRTEARRRGKHRGEP